MDFESPDGSQFSLRRVVVPKEDGTNDEYTSVTAYVNGEAYAGKLDRAVEEIEIDDPDLFDSLQPVPPGCIHPPFQEAFKKAPPPFVKDDCYHKAPSFTYDDCRPGNTFVADCFLNEIRVLESLEPHYHPNIVDYRGCVVKDGRITHICLRRYPMNLVDEGAVGLNGKHRDDIRVGLRAGVEWLHERGLAHNDIHPGNVCIDVDESPVIIDFESCLPFGQPLMKGADDGSESERPISKKENDFYGLQSIENFLRSCGPGPRGRIGYEDPRGISKEQRDHFARINKMLPNRH